MSDTPVIRIADLHFAYGDTPILRGIDLEMPSAQLTALVGPNGSGKSTLIRSLLGLLSPSQGEVQLWGASPAQVEHRWRIGYVPQRSVLDPHLPATVEEVVATGRLSKQKWFRRPKKADTGAVVAALEAVGLADRRSDRVQALSGGQQQRVLIARALASEPELLILDEPTTGVGAASQRRFRDTLVAFRSTGASVLLVSHELSAVADDLDRVVVLRRGKVEFDGSPQALSDTGVSLGVHAADLPVWLEGEGHR